MKFFPLLVVLGLVWQAYAADLISLSKADSVPPKVKVLSPKNLLRTSNQEALFSVDATDINGVSLVGIVRTNMQGQVESIDLDQDVKHPQNWTGWMSLDLGTNDFWVMAVDRKGNTSMPLMVRVIQVIRSPIAVQVEPNKGGVTLGITNGQLLELGKKYTITAKPARDHLFTQWTGSTNSLQTTLSFTMEPGLFLQAEFVSSPFPRLRGTYVGLFTPQERSDEFDDFDESANIQPYVGPELAPTNSGFCSIELTEGGVASGKVQMVGQSYAFAKALNGFGQAAFAVKRPGRETPLQVTLALDLSDADGVLHGQITDGQWISSLLAFRMTPWSDVAGRYTVAMPADLLQPFDLEHDVQLPRGHGMGSLTIDSQGMVSFAGSLGDGTLMSFSSGINPKGFWPVYVPLQSGKGVCLGWGWLEVNDEDCPYILVRGNLAWIKNPSTAIKNNLNTNGFAAFVTLTGAPYLPPANKAISPIQWTQGITHLQDGDLSSPVAFPVQWATNKLVVPNNTNRFIFALNPTTGLITGSFRHLDLKRTVAFRGCLIQWPKADCLSLVDDFIGGWFLGQTESGSFLLVPSPSLE